LRDTLVAGGVEAIQDLSTAWRSDGALSLDEELRAIEGQDLLDELEAIEGDHHNLYDEIEEYEYATDPTAAETFIREVGDWVTGSLKIEGHISTSGNGAIEYKYARETLLARDRFAASFRRSFHYVRRRGGLCTESMHYDRSRAMTLGLPLARVGHPFIEDLQKFVDADERGRAYAYWREVPDYGNEFETGNGADLYFRFDFLVEANLPGIKELILERGLAIGAVARRAADAFAPEFCTIWVDIDGVQVTDADLVAELERPYSRETDTNLRDLRWARFDALGLVADWSGVCQSAYISASALLKARTKLDERVRDAQRQLKGGLKAAERQLDPRMP
jgi:ATP-dependent helicase HepA